MVLKMDHLNIVVSNLEEATRFFRLLGFTEGIAAELDAAFLGRVTGIEGARGRFCALHHPGSDLSVELLEFAGGPAAEQGLGEANRIGLRHLAFAVEDIDAEVARLARHGVGFLSPVQTWEKTGKRLVYFRGPDGILLELAQYPKEPERV
ncbi:VOC family protein [Geomonas limicola]|uniref:VOC family protein n=1 Tax=Geomonas limicola TaxID=2740186 RepID=A0A6V8NAA0_9BACT|nr:VOC family protein [Geomonas limicola]GFO68747.1 VOC family protein [Geomonas limicola]